MRVYDLNDLDNWQEPQREAPAVPQSPKKKRRGGMIAVIIVLIAALIAEPFVFALIQGKPVSLTNAQINDKGELVLHYSDGTETNLGTVVGRDGTDGKDGVDGMDGADGTNGSNGSTTTITNVSAAATVGLRSAVSIFCTHYEKNRFGTEKPYYSAGSGVIYQINKTQGDAFVITNYHVVFDSNSRAKNGIAEEINLYLYGGELQGQEIKATYVGGSQNYDIAVLRVEDSEILKNSDAIAVSVGDSDAVRVGSTAIAIGNPESMGISASSGVISVDSEYITMTAPDGVTTVDFRVMRIDTAVNHGNSGGGLFDESGKFIGIVNAKTEDEAVENIGYALPSTTVMAVADNIIDFCFEAECENVRRPIMGVTVITAASTAVYHKETGTISIRETVQIHEVSPGQIGSVFQVGDILVSASLNGVVKEITRQHHVIDLMLTARPGDTVEFKVQRDGKEITLSVTVTEACLTDY